MGKIYLKKISGDCRDCYFYNDGYYLCEKYKFTEKCLYDNIIFKRIYPEGK